MKKTLLVLTVLCGLILGGCSTSAPPESPSLANIISSGDSIGAQDSLQVAGPTGFSYSYVHCVDAQQCSEMTGYETGYFKIYNSPDLGIKFSVYVYGNAIFDTSYYMIVRSGNTVSILPRLEGIQMFEKLSNENLEQAIKRVANIEGSGDCVVESATKVSALNGFDGSVYGPGYKGLIINYPESKLQESCPPDRLCYPDTFCGKYAVGGSVKIFVGSEDKNKFYFIDGGQDVLRGLSGKAWYEELQFLE